MNDEDELRQILQRAVPEPPSHGARTAAVVRVARARRVRRATVAGVVAVVVALAIPFGFAALKGDEVAPSGHAKAPAITCPKGSRQMPVFHDGAFAPSWPTVDPGSVQPTTGAVAARVCGPINQTQYPPDVLTTDVNRLVTTINAVPVTRQPRTCTYGTFLETVLPTIEFVYPNGVHRSVTIDYCRAAYLGVARQSRGSAKDVDRVLDLFTSLVLQQRAARGAVPTYAPLTCRDGVDPSGNPLSVLGNDPAPDLSRAILCVSYAIEDGHGRPSRRIPIPADDLHSMVDDLQAHASNRPAPACGGFPQSQLAIVGQNAAGDRFRLEQACIGFALGLESSWIPSKHTFTILNRLTNE